MTSGEKKLNNSLKGSSTNPGSLVYYFVDAGFNGYVLNVSNVRCSPSKVKYFKAVLHNGSKESALISFNPGLLGILESAVNTDRIFMLSYLKSKDDQFFGEKVMTLGDKSSIEYSKKQISFENVRSIPHKLNTFTVLEEIMTEIYVREVVNVVVFVSVESVLEEEISTKYGMKKKKDVNIYDNILGEMVKLTIWGNHLDLVREDGVYKFHGLRVTSFNGKHLTTAVNSIIVKSDMIIEIRK